MAKKKLTKKDLKKWEAKIQASGALFEPVKKQIDLNLEYYRGNQWSYDDTSYLDKTVDNMVYANVQSLKPSINFSNPRIFVSARKKPFQDDQGNFVDTTSLALAVEMLANYYYKELKLKLTADKILTDALLMPWGVAFIGFATETEKVDVKGDELEVNELIKSQSPYVVRIDPRDLRVDPRAKDSHLQDAEWIATRWVSKLEDVKANRTFKNTANLKANYTQDLQYQDKLGNTVGPGESEVSGELKNETALVEGWRIFDKKTHKEINIVKGHDEPLSYEDWGLDYDDGFPVETLYFNENPNELYPISDPEVYLSAQDELNRIRSLQLSHVKKVSERKYVTRKGSIEPEELSKLTQGGDGAIIESEDDPNTVLVPVSDATISQDLYIAIRDLKNSIREQSSVSAQESAVGQNLETATEAAMLAQGTRIKREFRTSNFEAFLVRVVRKLLMVVQQSSEDIDIPLSDEQFKVARDEANGISGKLSKMSKMIGGENVDIISPWLTLSPEDIKGDFEFELEIGSTRPTNQETRKQEVIQLAQLLEGNPFINQEEATKRILEVFEIRDLEKLMKPAEQVAEESQAGAEAQIEAEKEVDRQGKEVDLMKTEKKTETQLKVAALSSKTKITEALIKAGSEADKVNREREKGED